MSRLTIVMSAIALSFSLTLPARAVDVASSQDAPDLTAVREKIKAKDWPGAAADLRQIAEKNQHADVYNLVGFSLRNMGQYPEAKTYYAKALDFQPDHKGAHEYLGELYIKTGEMDQARAMLAKLEKICPSGCEELDDLKHDIAKADAKGAAKTN